MKSNHPVSKYMTTYPILIDSRAPLREADSLMTANRFRHLPVLKDGKPAGILSDRDLKLARSLPGVDLDSTTVENVTCSELYSVSPDTPVDDVAEVMSNRRIGSAVVVQNAKIVGIFTTTDALNALSQILRSEHRARRS